MQRLPGNPPRLKEADGDWIRQTCYESELQKVIERSDHLFRIDKSLKQPEHIVYLPLRTKTFQTIDIYLTSGSGELRSFTGGKVNLVLHL